MHLKISSGKLRPFIPGRDELKNTVHHRCVAFIISIKKKHPEEGKIWRYVVLKSIPGSVFTVNLMRVISCYIGRFMLCTAQLPGPVLKAFGWVQFSPLQLADKSPMITDQHTAGGSVSQLSQLAKLSPWLTLSTKDITTSFWHYIKSFCFWSKQMMGLYIFSNPTE